ncbi:hypothetical protein ACRALDRAFT_205350 [Sodiomyces alcalophilus JCM 7366]|uniref:uncharacterized protein n=1 Tax=Sodiomyces alcalophilus JCM 7366 TaxID=591952 RepID=UPI0039B4B83B
MTGTVVYLREYSRDNLRKTDKRWRFDVGEQGGSPLIPLIIKTNPGCGHLKSAQYVAMYRDILFSTATFLSISPPRIAGLRLPALITPFLQLNSQQGSPPLMRVKKFSSR